MKKILFFMSITIAIFIVILSCKKNLSDSDSMNNASSLINLSDQSIERQILIFKSNIEGNLKSGSSYPIDTAVRYIESLVNYTYSDVTNNLQGTSVDSVFITVSLSNGLVTQTEASNVYNKIVDSLTVQYQNLPSQNLHLILADVFSRDSVSGSVTFGIISAFAYGSQLSSPSFGQDDWWTFGWRQYNNGGYCAGPYFGTQKNQDAAGLIQNKLKIQIGVPAPGYRYYSDENITLDILPYGEVRVLETGIWYSCNFRNQNDQLDNYYDYLMFYNEYDTPNFHSCLSPTEMNFYWDGTDQVANEIVYDCLGEILEERSLTIVEIIGNNTTTHPNYFYYHNMINTYSIWRATLNEPEIFD